MDKRVVFESYMRRSGKATGDQCYAVASSRIKAEWNGGQMLTEVDRDHGPGRGHKKVSQRANSFLGTIASFGIKRGKAGLAVTVLENCRNSREATPATR